jgi:hypothetical protein
LTWGSPTHLKPEWRVGTILTGELSNECLGRADTVDPVTQFRPVSIDVSQRHFTDGRTELELCGVVPIK